MVFSISPKLDLKFQRSEDGVVKLTIIAFLIDTLLSILLILCIQITGIKDGVSNMLVTLQQLRQHLGIWKLWLYVGILGPCLEEYTFRVFIPRIVEVCRGSRFLGVVISSAGWALGHVHNPFKLLFTFLAGVNYCFLRFRSGSIFPTVILHMITNCFVLFVLMLRHEI